MKAQVKLGRVLGIEVGLHYSWFIIAALITMSLAAHFRETNSDWSAAAVWASAVIAAVAFFASLLVHELSHALVARSRGVGVKGITLFALGGVAKIEKDAGDARTEFLMGIVGPITSIVIGGVFLAAALLVGWDPGAAPAAPPTAILMWLGYINVVLGAFNLIPGYPLDGGRILRSALWWKTGNRLHATRIAAQVGSLVAFGFIIFGLFRAFTGAGFGGLWLAFIGWFLLEASRASYAQVSASEMLSGLRVRDLMAAECEVVDARLNVQTFVSEHLLRSGRRCYFVTQDDRLAGLVTTHEVKAVDPQRWPTLTVGDLMRPWDKVRAVRPDAPASEALEIMAREDINQLPVVQDGRVAGTVSRGHLLQVLQTRAELHM